MFLSTREITTEKNIRYARSFKGGASPPIPTKLKDMELKTTRTVLGAKVTTFNRRRTKVIHKKKEAYKGSIIAKNQKTAEKQDLLNLIQAKNWQSANNNISAKIEHKRQSKRQAMRQAGKIWKLKNKK